MWTANISKLSEDRIQRLKRWAENNTLCEQIMPYPKNVKDDLEMEDKYDEELKCIERELGWYPSKEQIEKLRNKYPYKQLRYDWRCNNWWSKWGLCECRANASKNELELQFETAWSPVKPIFQEISRKYKCKVYYEWSEPGNWFSGRAEWENWELIYEDNFDDSYFWEWVECVVCGQVYDWRCEDDWADMKKHICFNCWEEENER